MCCEQDPRGTCVEQADIDPGEIEVVEAASGNHCNATFQFSRFNALEKNHPSGYHKVAS